MASPGFLNNSPQHRTYWTVDRDLRYGAQRANSSSGPAGDAIAFDGKLFYEIRGYAPGRNLPGRGRELSPLDLYSVYSGSYGGMGEKENKSAIPALGRWEQRWQTPTPFAGHAIVAAENTVMAAGVPMLSGYTGKDTKASYAGEKGGIAWLLDASDGRQLQELRFDAAAGLGRHRDRPRQLLRLPQKWLGRVPFGQIIKRPTERREARKDDALFVMKHHYIFLLFTA